MTIFGAVHRSECGENDHDNHGGTEEGSPYESECYFVSKHSTEIDLGITFGREHNSWVSDTVWQGIAHF